MTGASDRVDHQLHRWLNGWFHRQLHRRLDGRIDRRLDDRLSDRRGDQLGWRAQRLMRLAASGKRGSAASTTIAGVASGTTLASEGRRFRRLDRDWRDGLFLNRTRNRQRLERA
jgi:hypothetical protein